MGSIACRLGGDAFAVITPIQKPWMRSCWPSASPATWCRWDLRIEIKPWIKYNVGVGPAIDTYDRSMYERAVDAIQEAQKIGLTGVAVADHQTAGT